MIIPGELLAAFHSTHYLVDLPETPLQLQIDAPNETLRRWLQSQGHGCAAVLTAHNPAAQRHTAAFNHASQAQLHAVLQTRGLTFHTGSNVDPQQRWPAEESVFVVGLSAQEAHELAAQFGQLAFLWCDASAVPRLHIIASG